MPKARTLSVAALVAVIVAVGVAVAAVIYAVSIRRIHATVTSPDDEVTITRVRPTTHGDVDYVDAAN